MSKGKKCESGKVFISNECVKCKELSAPQWDIIVSLLSYKFDDDELESVRLAILNILGEDHKDYKAFKVSQSKELCDLLRDLATAKAYEIVASKPKKKAVRERPNTVRLVSSITDSSGFRVLRPHVALSDDGEMHFEWDEIKVKKSSVPDRGDGVFANQDLEPFTIIPYFGLAWIPNLTVPRQLRMLSGQATLKVKAIYFPTTVRRQREQLRRKEQL